MVAAIGVHVHAGTISDADWRRGMVGQRRPDGTLYSQLQTRGADERPNPETLVVTGSADKISTSFDNGTATISLEGRDHRGLLLDAPLTPADMRDVDVTRPLDVVIRQIINKHTLLSPLVRVIPDPGDWSGELPSPAGLDIVQRSQRGARPGQSRVRATPAGGGNQTSFWDTITHYCFVCGAIAYFVGDDIHIRRVRDIYETADLAGSDARHPTTFRGGRKRVVDGEEFGVTRLVLGHNLLTYDKSRTLTGNRAKKVECVALNTSSNATGTSRVLRATWPADSQNRQPTAQSPRGQGNQNDVIRIPVHGVVSVERLTEIARSLYEEVSRGETSGSFKTKQLASFGGNEEDTDLIRLRPGMGVEMLVDRRAVSSRSPMVSELLRMANRSFDEQVQFVMRRVPDENLARVIVATARGEVSPLQRFFYITNVSHTWNNGTVQFDVEYTNYLDATREVDRSADEAASRRRVAASAAQAAPSAQRQSTAAGDASDPYARAVSDAERDFRDAQARETAERRAEQAQERQQQQQRQELNEDIGSGFAGSGGGA